LYKGKGKRLKEWTDWGGREVRGAVRPLNLGGVDAPDKMWKKTYRGWHRYHGDLSGCGCGEFPQAFP